MRPKSILMSKLIVENNHELRLSFVQFDQQNWTIFIGLDR